MKLSKNFRAFAVSVAVLIGINGLMAIPAVSAAVLQGFQGGTGISTGTSTDVGKNLQVSSTTPFLTYTLAVGGSGITSLNGSTSSTQTFATSGPLVSIGTLNGVHTFTSLATSSLGLQSVISFPIPVASTSLSVAGGLLSLNGNVLNNTANYVSSTACSGGLITCSASTGAITLNNTGNYVSSTVAGTGIGVSGATGSVTITNNGVQSLSASSTIGITSATGTPIIGAKFYPIQWIIENPTASENDGVMIFRATSTISECEGVNKTTGDTLTWGLGYSSSRATATSSLFQLYSAANTTTATTTPSSYAVSASSTPGKLNPLIFWTTAASSTQFTLTCYYSEN